MRYEIRDAESGEFPSVVIWDTECLRTVGWCDNREDAEVLVDTLNEAEEIQTVEQELRSFAVRVWGYYCLDVSPVSRSKHANLYCALKIALSDLTDGQSDA